MKRMVHFALFALALSLPVQVHAYDREGRGGREGRSEKARMFLVLRITDALDLSDEKALEISKILRRSGDMRQDLRRQRRALQQPLQDAVDAGDEKKIGELVTQANEIDRKLSLLPSETFTQMQGVLSPVERGKLTLLVPRLQKQFRGRNRRGTEGQGPRRRGTPGAAD